MGSTEQCSGVLKNLADNPTEKRTLGRPTQKWEDNIRIDLEEICVKTRNWVD